MINASNPVKSIDEIKPGGGKTITLGADATASSNFIFAVIAKEVLGLNIKLVRGYTGAARMFLAMQSGEIDGQYRGPQLDQERPARSLTTARRSARLMAFGRTTRHPEFPDIPTGRELTQDPKALALIDFAEIPFFMSLPFAAPPGVPADRAKALQNAFMAMCRDKALLEDAAKLGIDMSPIDGDGILQMRGPDGGDAEGRDRALQRDQWREAVAAKAGRRSGAGAPAGAPARQITPPPGSCPACGNDSAAACRDRCR